MGVVVLEILEPKNGANVVGTRVRMRGHVVKSDPATLFFKWYSSLVPTPPTETDTDTSLNREAITAGAALDFTPTLLPGSQVITFTARDVAGDAPQQLAAVKHGGMAGGPPVTPTPPNAPPPCVIHVLFAEFTKPAGDGALSRSGPVLEWKVPSVWDDPEYQSKINRLRFRWRFEPAGQPANRDAADFLPAAPVFVKEESILRYQGALPAALVLDTAYLLRLRVERRDDPSVFHDSAPRTVTINA